MPAAPSPGGPPFSPLIIGEWTATYRTYWDAVRGDDAFSPLIIGEWTATREEIRRLREVLEPFSPLIIGEWTATAFHDVSLVAGLVLSVP